MSREQEKIDNENDLKEHYDKKWEYVLSKYCTSLLLKSKK